MSCVDAAVQRHRFVGRAGVLSAMLLASACSGPPAVPQAPPAPQAAAVVEPRASASVRPAAALAPPVAPAAARPMPRNWDEFRQQAADRIVAANRGATYDGVVPEPLLAIPVLEVELRADGSVLRITVLRQPRQALDTVELASAAVRRAAPFGNVSHLPRPWKFNEVFLFNDERRFKLRTHDQ